MAATGRARRWLRRALVGVALLGTVAALAIVVRLQLVPPAREREYPVADVRAPEVPEDAASIARGEHVSRAIAVCHLCHGEDLGGGRGLEPGAPPGPDITASALDAWSFGEFARVMRTGTKPDGEPIDPRFMPWQGYRHMSDEEIDTLWRHLRSLRIETADAASSG